MSDSHENDRVIRDGYADAAALLTAQATDDSPALAQMLARMTHDELCAAVIALLDVTTRETPPG